MKFRKSLSVLLSTAFAFSFAVAPSLSAAEPYIAVVSKGEQHDFWQQVKLGAQKAAKDYGAEITFEGPPSESDVQIQVEMLNNAMAKNPVAIALAALDTSAVIDQLQECLDNKTPVIGFDSGVPNAPKGSIYANASTDNFNAAGLGAKKMFEVIKDKIVAATSDKPVTIVIMNQDASGESLLSRGKGFRDTMIDLIIKETPLTAENIKVTGNPAYGIKNPENMDAKVIIDMVVPASAAATDATASASAVLNKVADENILGVFCSNEATVKGLLAATNDGEDLGFNYKDLVVIGFDAGAGQKNAVRKGYFLGSVTQDPFSIGYKAVELAFKAYKGDKVADVDTGAKFYNSKNMDNADIKGLLYD